MNPNLKAAAISEYIGKAVRAMQEKKKKEGENKQLKQQQEDRKKGKYPIF